MTNTSPWPSVDGAALLVVSRYAVAPDQRAVFLADAERALAALARQAGFERGSLGQSTDEPGLFALRTEWVGVGAYRRALSAFDVKVDAVPLLSTAVDEPSAFEIVHDWTPTARSSAPSGLAADAGEVGLGAAAGAVVPPVTS